MELVSDSERIVGGHETEVRVEGAGAEVDDAGRRIITLP
jgi:hypothetical protein